MFAKNRTARLAAILALVAGSSVANAADDVIVQPDGTVVKPMPKWKQRKLERKIAKLSGGDVVVEGTPTVPVRTSGFFKSILPRRDVRTISPAPRSIVAAPAPIVRELPLDDSSASTTSRPIVTERPIITERPIYSDRPVITSTPLVPATPVVIGAPTTSATAPDSSVSPARNVEVIPPPVVIAPNSTPIVVPPAEAVPPPAEPAEPALEPVKAPRDSA